MSKFPFLLEQAARFDRVADQCSVRELIPYYRKLAQDCREQAAIAAMAPGEDLSPHLDGGPLERTAGVGPAGQDDRAADRP
jgi:hypothetical protein